MIGLWSRRGRITLGAIGLALAVAPIVGAQLLIEHTTRQHARETVREIAEENITWSENAIDRGVEAVDALARGGVSGCIPGDLALMRRTVASTVTVKEVALVDAGGNPVCNQYGTADSITPLSPPQPLDDLRSTIQSVRVQSTGAVAVMVMRVLTGGRRIAAFISGDAIARGTVPRPLKGSATGSLILDNGVKIGSLRSPDTDVRSTVFGEPDVAGDMITADIRSQRLPIAMRLSVPYRIFADENRDLLTYARLGGGLASTLIFALLVYLLRGPPVEIARLREAEAQGEFVPYYQPVIDIGSGRLVGCEALIRWVKPNGTVVEPNSFIELAESSGLAVPMTRSLMRAVRSDLDHAFGTRPQLKISINLFNDHFARLKTVHDIEDIFRGARVSFSQLVFELTERQPLRDIRRARVIIRELQGLGARVALDDAGAGHGGLAYLHQLGVDMIKIDRLFVGTIGPGKTASPIVDSLIRLGHDLGMRVVAEGVETYEQLDYLRQHGADSAQGFLFSPPLPARAFLDLVETMEPAVRDLAAQSATLPDPQLAEPASVSAA